MSDHREFLRAVAGGMVLGLLLWAVLFGLAVFVGEVVL